MMTVGELECIIHDYWEEKIKEYSRSGAHEAAGAAYEAMNSDLKYLEEHGVESFENRRGNFYRL